MLTALNSHQTDRIAKTWLTPEGIIDWLGKKKNIYKLTNKDLQNLGIDFIDVEKLVQTE